MENELISVVMPNYNTSLPFLEEAVNSILTQTYSNFEFIIVDDCSTDESYGFLQSLKDPRIHLIRNEKNMGVTASLNKGFRLAKGAYIARMDSDDISFPTRFERQLAFMTENPDVIVCGTFAEEIGDSHSKRCKHIPNQKTYQCGVLFGNVYGLIHPTAFFRASELWKNHICYDENIKTAQDYAMWANCCRYGQIANVEEILFNYRIHKSQISSAKKDVQKRCTMYTQKLQLEHLFPQITDEMVEIHYQYCISHHVTPDMRRWFQEILNANDRELYVDQAALHNFVKDFLIQKVLVEANCTHNSAKLFSLWIHATKQERRALIHSIRNRITRKVKNQK